MLKSFSHWSLVRHLADRTFRVWSRQRLAQLERMDIARTQTLILDRLMRRAEATQFGRRHDFGRIRTPEDFRRLVPLRNRESYSREFGSFPRLENVLWPGVIPFFASKAHDADFAAPSNLIPVTRAVLRSFRMGFLTALAALSASDPHATVLSGHGLLLSDSSKTVALADGVQAGEWSTIFVQSLPTTYRPFLQLFDTQDQACHLPSAPGDYSSVTWICGSSRQLHSLFNQFNLADRLHPALSSSARWILRCVEKETHESDPMCLSERQFRKLDVRAGPEGFFAITDLKARLPRLIPDLDIYFEFIPWAELEQARPTRHGLWEVVPGMKYAMSISSSAGLWAYVLSDPVQFVSRQPPLLHFLGAADLLMHPRGEADG